MQSANYTQMPQSQDYTQQGMSNSGWGKKGLLGGLVQSYIGGLTGGAVASGAPAAETGGPSAAGSQLPAIQQPAETGQPVDMMQAGMQRSPMQNPMQKLGGDLMAYAEQQRPAMGLLGGGVDAYKQGSQDGGGFSGGMSNVGSNLVDSGQNYYKSLASFF